MRIQHNIAALNAHRQLTSNNSSVAKNLEKLSSGYKINRAGDDAAGLAISEKMRAQITGLETAQKNANDGISLVQTAEGALTEVHSMLNRMVELAEQSANGTYDNDVDRANLQKELDSLRSEIDRIADGTNFNGINLLDGSLGGAKVTSTKGTVTGATPGTFAAADMEANGLKDLALSGISEDGNVTAEYKAAVAADKAAEVEGDTLGGSPSGVKITAGNDATLNGKKITVSATGAAGSAGALSFDADGNLTITIASDATAEDLSALLTDTNIQAATGYDDITDAAVKDAWKDVTGAGSLAAANVGDLTLAGGTTKSDAKVVLSNASGDEIAEAVMPAADGAITFTALNDSGVSGTATVDLTKIANIDAKTVGAVTGSAAGTATSGSTKIEITNQPKAGDTLTVGDTTYEYVKAAGDAVTTNGATAIVIGADVTDTATNLKTALGTNAQVKEVGGTGSTVTFKTADKADGTENSDVVKITQKSSGLTLQIGDTADSFNKLSVSVGSMKSADLGIGVGDIDISTQAGASEAIKKIKDAINTVSSTRGDLGAIQNRLEHTINNLSVTAENMTAAESRIRDVDMAEEMMEFTKNNILTQASQAMLAQANQLPQGVLQLLQ